jgi:prepilin-type processing-associated H-X9-DG protein
MAWGDPKYSSDGKGASVLYIDGHVEFLEEPELTQVMERFFAEYEEKYGERPTVIEPH